MQIGVLIRRFLVPGFVVTLRAYLKYGCMVSPKAEVELTPHLKIGRKSIVSSFTKLKATDGPLEIGSHVEISNGCVISSYHAGTIIGNNYRYDRLDVPIRLQDKVSPKGIRIGDNVWIGAGCTILDGADIGSGSIVTPNSVVSHALPENSIAQGNPAKVIFKRR
jgi:acetyltransferase-like isoleucine patch superfamily enzyme